MDQFTVPKLNLLSDKKTKFDKNLRFSVKVKMWSGVVLVGYIAVLIVGIVVNQVYGLRLSSTKKALDKAKLDLTSKIVLIEEYNAVIDRGNVIKSILAKRRESIDLWNKAQKIMPEQTELTGFNLNESVLKLTYVAPNVVVANQLMSVVDAGLTDFGSSKTAVSLRRDAKASYSVDLEMELSK